LEGLPQHLVGVVAPEIVGVAEQLASAVQNLATTSPALLKLGVGIATIAAAAGPLMFALELAALALSRSGASVRG
jgi:hypothetical protein